MIENNKNPHMGIVFKGFQPLYDSNDKLCSYTAPDIFYYITGWDVSKSSRLKLTLLEVRKGLNTIVDEKAETFHLYLHRKGNIEIRRENKEEDLREWMHLTR